MDVIANYLLPWRCRSEQFERKKNYYEDSSEEYCCGSFHSRERERQTATDRERGEGGKEKEREKLTLELCLPIVLQQLDLCPH